MQPPPNSTAAGKPERLDRFEAGYAGALPKLRPDLLITEYQIAGRTNFVIKDPVSLRYFRVERQELALAQMLDGKRNARIIREELVKQFPDFDLDDEKILRFVNSLAGYGFLLLPGERHLFYLESMRKAKRRASLSRLTSSFLYFRFSVYDPNKLFGKIAKHLGFIYSKAFGLFSIAFILFGVFLVLTHWQEFIGPKVDFFTIRNLFLTWVLYILTKVVHEFGHGVTCRYYGAETHEIGLLLIVLTPCFYVDVSDAWMVPNKWHRVLITLAGIYVEVIMAAAAAIVWVNTEPGLANQVAFNLMILCSISTIVFNANPLLRYDGYYIVSDWMEVPNLRSRSNQFVNALLSKWIFGKSIDVAALTGTNRNLFMIYAVAAYIYGIFIMLIIAFFFQQLLEPVGLSYLGTLIGVLSLSLFFVMPFAQLVIATRKAAAHRQTSVYGLLTEGGRHRRPLASIFVVLAVLTGIAMFPSEFSVERNCVVQPVEQRIIRPTQAGFLREFYKKDGETVQVGEKIALLQNLDLETALGDLRLQRELTDVVIRHSQLHSNYPALRQAELQQSGLNIKIKKLEQQLSELVLRSPIAGVLTTPRLQDMVNRYFKTGDPLCVIAPLDRVRVLIPLSEQEATHVRPDAVAHLRVYSQPNAEFTGHVTNDPLALVKKDLDPALASRYGGDVPTVSDMASTTDEVSGQAQTVSRGRDLPSVNTYLAELDIVNSDRWLRPGMTGRAQIVGAKTTLGGRVMRTFWDSFSLDFRL